MARPLALLLVALSLACGNVETPDDGFEPMMDMGAMPLSECEQFGGCFSGCLDLAVKATVCNENCPTQDEVDAEIAMCEATCATEWPEVTQDERDQAVARSLCLLDATTAEDRDACNDLASADCNADK